MRALITALTLSILLALFNTAAIAQNADAQTGRDLQTIVDRAVRERFVNMMGHRCQIAEARYHHAAKFDEGTSYWCVDLHRILTLVLH